MLSFQQTKSRTTDPTHWFRILQEINVCQPASAYMSLSAGSGLLYFSLDTIPSCLGLLQMRREHFPEHIGYQVAGAFGGTWGGTDIRCAMISLLGKKLEVSHCCRNPWKWCHTMHNTGFLKKIIRVASNRSPPTAQDLATLVGLSTLRWVTSKPKYLQKINNNFT